MHKSNRCHIGNPALGCVIGLLAACSENNGAGKPASFSATRAEVTTDDRIARCNTVHSQTLPQAVQRRYGIDPAADTAVITCSLQIRQEVPVNIAAQIAGTQQALSGPPTEIEFREILEETAVSYVATFDFGGKTEVRFKIAITDPRTGQTYHVDLRQDELPGRA